MKVGGTTEAQRATCMAKRRYVSQETAEQFAEISFHRFRTVLRPYRCCVCKHWHLTSRLPDPARDPGSQFETDSGEAMT